MCLVIGRIKLKISICTAVTDWKYVESDASGGLIKRFALRGNFRMTSYHYDIPRQSQRAGRLIGRLRDDLRQVVEEGGASSGEALRGLAKRAGMTVSDLRGLLEGRKELTLRVLSNLVDALDREVAVELRAREPSATRNYVMRTATPHSDVVFTAGKSASTVTRTNSSESPTRGGVFRVNS